MRSVWFVVFLSALFLRGKVQAVSLRLADVPCQRTITVGPEVTSIGTADVDSPYLDFTHCRWNITGPLNTQLRISFDSEFDVEKPAGTSLGVCTADFITILDAARPGLSSAWANETICAQRPTIAANQLNGPYCGQTAPTPFLAKRNSAVVQFCTDYEVTGAGWRINLDYTPIIPPEPWVERVITLRTQSDTETIESPNYPEIYEDDYVATYRIINELPTTTVLLRAVVFDLGRTGCGDTLVVKDITNNLTIVTACAIRPLQDVEIKNSGEILVEFRTDVIDSYRGFSLEASLLTCASSQFACDDLVGCYSPSEACDGSPQCLDGSDEKVEYCVPDCGTPHFPIAEDHTGAVSRIVGGIVVNRHSLPWQVAIFNLAQQWCGGTILSDRWILSAAHCFAGKPVSNFRVRVGGHSVALSDEADRSTTIAAEKIICHPLYQKLYQLDYDHCLVKLASKIPFRKNVAPACIPPQDSDVDQGTRCMVSGWGDTLMSTPGRAESQDDLDSSKMESVTRVASNRLRQTFIPVLNRTHCNTIAVSYITERMICAGTVLGGTNSCHGDSGGPFVCQRPDGRWSIDGSVSFGPRVCATANVPAVYARTGSVTHWITDTISSN